MTDRRLPLGPWPIVIPSLAITGAVLLGTLPKLAWPFQEWVRTSAEFHQQNAFAAPIAAAAATYYAGRLTPPHRIFAPPYAERAGLATVVRHLTVLVGTFLTAYLVGLVPLVVETIGEAQYGRPAPLVMLTGFLGLTAATAAGYAIGVVGRTSLLAPVSFVLMFGVTVLGTGGDTFSALAPVLHISPPLGSVQTLPFVTYRIVFLLTSSLAIALVSANVLRRHRDNRRMPSPRALAPLALVALLAVPPLVNTPALFAFESNPPRVCEVRAEVEYCVHAGHRTQLADMVAAVKPVVERYGSASGLQVYDEALRGVYVTFENRQDAYALGIVWYPVQPQLAVNRATVLVSNALSGLAACRMDQVRGDSYRLATDLARWLSASGSADEEPNAFRGRSAEAMRSWISRNRESITTCSLTGADLP